MEIHLYVNSSEKNQLGKTLGSELILTGNLRDEASVTNPVILIQADNVSGYNYAYVKEFNRYYFIRNMVSVRTGLWRIELSVDVLESYKTEIKKLSVILRDTETTGATNYLSGDVWKTNVKETTNIINFSGGLSDTGEFILITAGG